MTDRFSSFRNAPSKPALKPPPRPVKSLFDEAAELGANIASPFLWVGGLILVCGLMAAAPVLEAWTEKLKSTAMEKYYQKLEGTMR